MFDIYIDEDKVNKSIGFLVVKNTPYIQQFLLNQRIKQETYYEVHFAELNNKTVKLYTTWIDIFFSLEKTYNYSDLHISFYRRNWSKTIDNKEEVIIDFIQDFKKIHKTDDIVAILDFDSEHKNLNLENAIRSKTKICRCYHFSSKAIDLLQFSDLILGASIRGRNILNDTNYNQIESRIKEGKYCKTSELKNYIGTYLYKKINTKNYLENKINLI